MRILKEKLILFHHISCLPDTTVAKQVLSIQQHFNFRGLHEEVREFINKHQITDIRSFSKMDFKRYVREKIHSENREYLINWSKSYKKIDSLSLGCENYEFKKYFHELNLADSRIKFRERSSCMKTCRTMFPSDKENIKAMFQCYASSCSEIDILSHWKYCKVYSEIWKSKNLNLEKDSDLIRFYKEVIKSRTNELDQ